MAIILTPITRISDTPQVETKGSFQAGTIGLFFITFVDIEGELFDPSNIDITIKDPDGETAETIAAPDQLEMGKYAVEITAPEGSHGLVKFWVRQ